MKDTPQRNALLPHMAAYEQAFSDSADVRWSPYTVFFHPCDHESPVVNTDRLGFRLSIDGAGRPVSVAQPPEDGPLNVLAGSSTAFGIGASTDAHTLPSLLSQPARTGATWVNLAGRSFNAIQEYLLAALHHHRLPTIDRIVVLSGFNNLGLARQPAEVLDDHGTFFMRQRYEALQERGRRQTQSIFRRVNGSPRPTPSPVGRLPLDEQLGFATQTIGRALTLWSALAELLGAELTFVLQPLANWVRPQPCEQERLIFAELEHLGGFESVYGEITTPAVHDEFSTQLEQVAKSIGLRYVDGVPALAQDTWAYVDRIHFTDVGHDIFADAIANAVA